MRTLRHTVLLLLVGWMPLLVSAQPEPGVRIAVTPEAVPIGQPIRLRVTVLVPTWFSKPPRYPTFELANAITRLPPDSAFPTSPRIGGATWAGIVRDYTVYPQLGARYRMTGQTMTVTYAHPETRRPITVEVAVPEIAFRGTVPTGAEALTPYLGGTEVALERTVAGNLERLSAGDAVVVTVTATIEGMPAMFLPSLVPVPDQAGLKAYAREPRISDGPPATRTEMVTYVFESGGEFQLPAVKLSWWNTTHSRLETAALPVLPVSIAGPPVATARDPATAAERALDLRSYLALGGILILVLLVGYWPRLAARLDRRRATRRQSEAYAFRALRRALATRDVIAVDQCLRDWLARLGPGVNLSLVADRGATPQLSKALRGLTQEHFNGGDDEPAARLFTDFSVLLARCRKNYLRWQERSGPEQGLPRLNP